MRIRNRDPRPNKIIFYFYFIYVWWKNIPHIHGIFLSVHLFKLHVPLHLHNSTLLYLTEQNQTAK